MCYTMKTVCTLSAIAAVATIMAFSFRHSVTEETDYRMSPGPVGDWQNAVIDGQELDDQVRRVQQRCDAKAAVVADVIDGRLTLFEAAARFRTLDASNPRAAYWLAHHYRDQQYELALCHSIIHRAKLELRSRGSGLEDDTVTRLKSELAEHLQRHGQVCLTD